MVSLKALSSELVQAKNAKGLSDLALAKASGVTRQSIARALSGKENFGVTSLLSIADALGLVVMLVPAEAAQALRDIHAHNTSTPEPSIPSVVDQIKNL